MNTSKEDEGYIDAQTATGKAHLQELQKLRKMQNMFSV